MQLLLRHTLRDLVNAREHPCVSIFAPMVEAGRETRQNRTRFKNLVNEAHARLVDTGITAPEADALLKPARDRIDDQPFWQHQSTGFAFFRSPGLTLEHRLPVACDDTVVVADHFHVKPLLPLLKGDGRFFVLAISKGEVRLFEASRTSIAEIHLEDMPRNLAEALSADDPEKSLQWHTRTSGVNVREAMFHGHGVHKDVEKENILRYFRKINAALHDMLKESSAPLVLAGVEYLLPIYQEANTYPLLMDRIVEGNSDAKKKRPDELLKEAWGVVQPHFERAQQEAISLYGAAAGTARRSGDLKEILIAAHDGRVAVLFVAVGAQCCGRFDLQERTIQIHETGQPGDVDLLNLAAMRAYATGAAVYALRHDEMPGGGYIAALYRY